MELINSEECKILLHYAIEHKSEKYIRSLLMRNIDVNELDKNNRSALHIAVAEKKKEIVKLLLENGANVNIKEKHLGMTPLHLAIKQTNLPIARLLLERGANVNEVTKHNSTALHIALEVQDEQLVKLTLDRGANIDAKKFGKSPLHLAVEYTNIGLAKLLLDRGSNVNDACIDGQTALHIAIEMKDIEMVKLLLSNGAKTDVKKFGRCPLYLAVSNGCIEIAKLLLTAKRKNSDDYKNRCTALELAFQKKNQAAVETFLEHGVDPNSKLSDKSPLHLAAEHQWLETVQLLVRKGADVSAVTRDNVSPLHVALERKNTAMARLLLQSGAEVNVQQCRSGLTPLHTAVKNGCQETTRLLLQAGASPNVPSNLNVTALHIAFDARDLALIGSLLEYGADPNAPKYGKSPLELAIECRWTDLARQLLARGANPEAPASDGASLLLASVRQRNAEALQLLLEFGASADRADPRSRLSPLQVAAACRFQEGARLLLRAGARVDHAADDGTTALHLALEKRDEGTVRLLLEAGASLDIKRRNMSPLHVAAEGRWLEVARTLLARGARVDERTVYLVTPLFLAVEKRDLAMARLLLEHGADVNYRCYGLSLLHVAAGQQCARMVALLLDRGAAVNAANLQDEECISALHIALKKGDERLARLLIERRASVRMPDRKLGRLPLHLAAEAGCAAAARLLLERGARVDARDKRRVTPLQLAVMRNRPRLAELLLEHGADANARNASEHYTSLHYAVLAGSRELAQLLLRAGARMHCAHEAVASPLGLALRRPREDGMLRLLLAFDHDGAEELDRVRLFLGHVAALPEGSACRRALLEHLARSGTRLPEAELERHGLSGPALALYESCLAEVARMRAEPFYEGLSCHSLLGRSGRALAVLVRNESLVRAFEESDYRLSFPIYADTLADCMRRAQELDRVHAAAESMIGVLFKRELPHLLNRQILSHLSYTEVRLMGNMYTELQPAT